MEMQRAMRRGCGRIGWGLGAYMLCVVALGTGLQLALEALIPGSLDHAWVIMLVSDVVTYGIAPVVLWVILRPLPVADGKQRGLTPKRMGKLALESIGLMYSASLVTTGLIALMSRLTGRALGNLLDTATEDMNAWEMLIFMVLIAPICEELIFRRMLFRRLLPMGENFAIVMSALAFSLFHCNLFQALYAFTLGILFGCIVARTGRIRYAVVLHMMLNLMGSVILVLLEPYEIATSLYVLVLYVLMAVGLAIFVRDRRNLFSSRPNLPGCWRAAFTSGGMLTFVILLGLCSIGIVFLV